MERHRPKKALGQNFLTDTAILGRIVDASALVPEDHVLEIGPGRGALTSRLAPQVAGMVAVELDRDLAPLLARQFPSVDVVSADILKVDLVELLHTRWEGGWKVVANLPYNISSQVLFRFLDNRQLFSLLILMFQKEVGERLLAPPDCKEYGILSVFCRLHFDITRVVNVKPGAFYPVPKVHSVVLRMTPLPAPRVDVGDEVLFRRVVKAAFNQRRKTLWNCLRSAGLDSSEHELELALSNAGIDGKRRGETLSLEEFAALTRAVLAGRLTFADLPFS